MPVKEYPETHQKGLISVENIPDEMYQQYLRACWNDPVYIEGDFGIKVAEDGRVWVCINGVAFIRFKPGPR